MVKTFWFRFNCVGSNDGQGIYDMVQEARQITWHAFLSHVEIDEVRRLFPDYSYQGEHWGPYGITLPMHLKDDPSVFFWKSKYRGEPCYYICHSGIEYIFLEERWGIVGRDSFPP